MTVTSAVCTRILSLTAVTNLVGQNVYALVARQGVRKFVRVQRVGGAGRAQHMRGESNAVAARVQVDVYTPEQSGIDPFARASAISDAIRGDGDGTGLSGFAGDIGGSPAFRIDAILTEGEAREEIEVDGATRWARVSQDYMVRYRG